MAFYIYETPYNSHFAFEPYDNEPTMMATIEPPLFSSPNPVRQRKSLLTTEDNCCD